MENHQAISHGHPIRSGYEKCIQRVVLVCSGEPEHQICVGATRLSPVAAAAGAEKYTPQSGEKNFAKRIPSRICRNNKAGKRVIKKIAPTHYQPYSNI
ncbi:hypothetical protein [Acidithiobacillus ferriphilus]|nr:hypothetical protein [Acidithiobacillus ferriphilus]